MQPIEQMAPIVFNVVQAADQLTPLDFEVDPPYPVACVRFVRGCDPTCNE